MTGFNLSYPHEDEGHKQLTIQSGEILFMVGSNGTGKSTLMHVFTTQNIGSVRRITAHRQVWFNTDSIDLTPASRLQTEQNINMVNCQEQSRWKDEYAQQRSQAIIFDLIDSENIDARKIAKAARSNEIDVVRQLASIQSPVAKMNDILRISNLHFQVSIDQGSKLVALREGLAPYSIAELSDGERNALLIISDVLTANENTLILLDEPERHLHRSIVSPLISTLLSYRRDCAFVISTHDVTLPQDQEKASALLLRKYNHQPKSWLADYIQSLEEMDEEVAQSVLGSRRVLLFVEGRASSLDLQLYQIMYPEVTIKPLGSCVDVERAVKGIRESSGNHWISAFGIIDRDDRSDDECEVLCENGVIPLNHYSVESLYYHPAIIMGILNRVSILHEIDSSDVYANIVETVINVIIPHKERLAARLVQRKAKETLSKKAPDWKEIQSGGVEITFSPSDIYAEELQLISSLLQGRNIEKLIARYPVRETPALEMIAKKALFPSIENYEQSVRKMLIESPTDLDKLKRIMEPVTRRVCPT
jgi:ABC-type lipoprotein export system ATPase subunit